VRGRRATIHGADDGSPAGGDWRRWLGMRMERGKKKTLGC
jgi:hypothetical protein